MTAMRSKRTPPRAAAKRGAQPKPSWRCPQCGREFRFRTKEHSCDIRTLSAHLDRATPEVKAAFSKLTGVLDELGPYELVPVKTMIVLTAETNFGGVVVRRNSLDLGFFLARALQHPRVTKLERLSPRKIAHHVIVSESADIDREVVSWLREAYVECVSRGRT